MGRAPLISFAYEVHATPEPSRAHRSRTMPRCLGSIASHDASMLDHLASHLASLAPCLDDARTLARTLPRCLATEPTSWLAVIA